MEGDRLKGHMMVLTATVIWALSIIVTKNTVAVVTPLQTVVTRFALAAVALWILCPKWDFDRKREPKVILLALLSGSLYMLVFNYGAMYTYASNVSIINCTSPIFTAIIVWAFLRERVSRNKLIGYMLAFAGIVLVIMNGASNPQINPIGDMMILVTSFLWATYCVLIPRLGIDCGPLMMTRKIMTYAVLFVLPIAMFEMPSWDLEVMFATDNLLNLLYLGLLASAMAYLLWNKGLGKIGALNAQFYIYLQPIITLVAAVIISGETVTLMGLSGFAMVLLGLVLSSLRRTPKRKRA